MRIIFSGKATKLSKQEARYAIRFFADRLISRRLSKTITIKLIFENLGRNHPGGECGWTDRNVRPKEYEITVGSNFGRRSQLLSIAHEMVHLKQFATGEMTDSMSAKRPSHTKWRNKYYNYKKVDYWDHPWEIEAYGRELGLYVHYKMHLKIQKDYKKFCRNNK